LPGGAVFVEGKVGLEGRVDLKAKRTATERRSDPSDPSLRAKGKLAAPKRRRGGLMR
jgi:hypothetical protein